MVADEAILVIDIHMTGTGEQLFPLFGLNEKKAIAGQGDV